MQALSSPHDNRLLAQVQMTQTAQRAICTRRHLITQQVALCLLQQADHSSSTEVLMMPKQVPSYRRWRPVRAGTRFAPSLPRCARGGRIAPKEQDHGENGFHHRAESGRSDA